MSDLQLDGESYTWEWVRRQGGNISPADYPPHVYHSLRFVWQWLSGQTTFSLTTSGSTGAPRPIHLTRAQMQASARATGAALGLQPGDHALVCLNPAFVAGVMMLVRGLELGLRLTVIAPTSRPLGGGLSAESRFDFTAFVPLQLHSTLRHAEDTARLNQMKGVLIGGAALSPTLAQEAQHVVAPLYHTYGMTETVSHIALRRINGPQAETLFTPLPGVTCQLDERGCLMVRGPMTADAWVTTNDRVDITADGRLRWLGRIDHVINSGGVKVQAEEVEEALQRLLPEQRLCVLGLPDERLGQCVTAVIEGAPFDTATLQAQLAGQLAAYAAPRRFEFRPHLPLTPSGKIDRPALLALLLQGAPAMAAPAT